MSICLIFFLLRILIATLWPVRTCSAILTWSLDFVVVVEERKREREEKRG